MALRVGIIGSHTLLGKHLVQAVLDETNWDLSLWSPVATEDSDAENNNGRCREFSGTSIFREAVEGCDTVFCLHELQDLSALPDVYALKSVNVNFVEFLKHLCEQSGVRRFVFLSSFFVQCSRTWPNINSRELNAHNFKGEVPFPEYSNSKILAEDIVEASSPMQRLIVRVGPLYGEGDTKSIICDAIKYNSLPCFTDRDGVIQMTYAGNVAYGMIAGVKKMIEEPKTFHCETVLLLDDTPISNYSTFLDSLITEREMPKSQHVFLLFYWMYSLFTFLLARLSSRASRLPSSDWIQMMCYQWTFFNCFKANIFMDYVPKYGHAEARSRSAQYYNGLHSDQVECYSWQKDCSSCFRCEDLDFS